MSLDLLAPWLPLFLCGPIIIVAVMIRRIKIALPASALWPESENPGLAMELASSSDDAIRILGDGASDCGRKNREQMVKLQQRDFAFIALYVTFFAAISASHHQMHPLLPFATCLVAVLAGLFDTFENLKIIQLCRKAHGSPKTFAQSKWIFFFTAVALAALCFVFTDVNTLDKQLVTYLIGTLALASGAFGIVAAVQAHFEDLMAAVKVSACVLIAVAFLPIVLHYGISLTQLTEYAMLMRVPALTGLLLLSLPLIARFTGAKALLLGLFDVTPFSVGAVTLAATSVAGIVTDNTHVIYMHSAYRIAGLIPPQAASGWVWLALTVSLSLPVIVFTVFYSNEQNNGDLGRRIGCAAGALAGALLLQAAAVFAVRRSGIDQHFGAKSPLNLLDGYFPLADHISAAAGFLVALGIYICLGVYGYRRLGKRATVPALCSALMVMMLVCSGLSALSFFLDKWHVPLLLVLLVAGVITAQSSHSDHLYNLLPKSVGAVSAPTPIETLRATRRMPNGRVVVVAANGGGIQAAAWAAQVLEGLSDLSPDRFDDSLRLISSVSGGSLGSACYTYRRAQGENARKAADAAARSSLDEVAWGLGWTDFISSVFPFGTRNWIGRGRALEEAWVMNCSTDEEVRSKLDEPLSNWNAGVRSGDLPAVILNATIVETGQRLLLGTTCFSAMQDGRARVDASTLHGSARDVAAVTAARLSASFPFVTPASRCDLDGPQPHVVDGGYYDNYGMSTLVEWLDEALEADSQAAVKSVLVIQIHGSPVDNKSDTPDTVQNRGWFFQILAPILTLNSVRGAGQIAHNDIELNQLQDKWFERDVPIHSVTFEFPDDNAPLSWHLTRAQQERILHCWKRPSDLDCRRGQVRDFLEGSDSLECACPTCNYHLSLLPAARAAVT